jgi:single-stranded-DNA-specific exonuclease
VIDRGSWRIAPVPYAAVRALSRELGVSHVLAEVLVRRGYADPAAARSFLQPDYRVYDPYLMAGMAEARRRIDRALQRGEPVAVHGDYDVDGIPATFLLVSVLRDLGADVRWHLPNRFAEGYGVSREAVDDLAAGGVRLLVTVDCGIAAREEVEHARSLGMDVIVTDHHEPEGSPPDCVVVTPKLGGYPCRELAGVGVAFKLAHALLEEPRGGDLDVRGAERVELPLALRPLTDVVAVGTIADVVPLVDENRVLAAVGLGRLRSAPRPGLAALLEVAGVRPGAIGAGTVGFRLGPRLNAAGRLEDASLALELLECESREQALPLALRLNELNQERQAIEASILEAAVAMAPEPLPPALVLSSPDWHEGVVGIVASRMVERFNRPTILLSESGDEAKGSGRSIAGFDLLAAVESGADHLLAFGGHRAACGLRLERGRIAAFREAFVAHAAAVLSDDDLVRTLPVDAVVGGDELTLQLADELERLAPHGMGNRAVTLLLHDAEIHAPRRTRDGRHLQLRVSCDGASCRAIHFNFDGAQELTAGGRYDVPLALGKNEYNGSVSAQVEVKALQRIAEPAGDLCATPCDLGCGLRLCGAALREELFADRLGALAAASAGPAAAALTALHDDDRLVDRRGRPVVSSLAALAATGERVVVLVADVARRRPLLGRHVLAEQLGRRGLYIQAACSDRIGEVPAGPGVVMAGLDLAVARPELTAAFDHVVVLDPPFTRRLLATVAAAVPPRAWLHLLWGAAEADFAARVRDAEFDLDRVLRRCWRALAAGSGAFDDALEQELLGGDPFLRSATATGAALRTLSEAGLLHVEGADYHLERPGGKVDVTDADTYRAWHALFQTPDFLPTCRTARL